MGAFLFSKHPTGFQPVALSFFAASGSYASLVRDGSDYTVCHQETSGNAVYLVCETRHSYSTVCVKNHGYDGSYLVKVTRELMGYLN